jgi:2',3'-cyclic-nucleotide 2'-phosphodiesterase (5'-nucleotidase family)
VSIPLLLLGGLLLGGASAAGATTPEVSLVVTADARGAIDPCQCPGLRGSGWGLKAALFRKLHLIRPDALFLDAGGFLPEAPETDTALVELTVRVLEILQYDAVCPGERALFLGPEALRELGRRLPLVCANVRSSDGAALFPTHRVFERAGARIAVTGIVDPILYYSWDEAFSERGAAILVEDPAEAIGKAAAVWGPVDAVVVLAHGDLEFVAALGEALQGVDVIVQGHEPALERFPGLAGAAVLIEPGSGGAQILEVPLRPGAAEPYRPLKGLGIHLVKSLKQTEGHVDVMVREYFETHGEADPSR